MGRSRWIFFLVLAALVVSSCAAPRRYGPPDPSKLHAPEPIQGNGGRYMCPYTSDGVLAMWVDKGINAKLGGAIGKTVGSAGGAIAGYELGRRQGAGFLGALLGAVVGGAAGEAIGREAAIEAMGGMEVIEESSDLSFNSVEDMAVYLYVNHRDHEHYNEALDLTGAVYPEFREVAIYSR